MTALRIVQLIDGLNVGGAETLLCQLVQGLHQRRHDVAVVYSTPGPLAAEISTAGVPLTRLPRLARVDPWLLWGMCRVLVRHRPQVVHAHLFKSSLHGVLAARLCGIPVIVVTLHSPSAWATRPWLGRLYGQLMRRADRLIAVSEDIRRHFITHAGLPPGQVVTIPNGVSLERFGGLEDARQRVRYELNIGRDAPVIGLIGRLIPEKDPETFLQAAVRIGQAEPRLRCLVVGGGPLREALAARARDLGLSERVIFTGLRQDIPAILAALDVLVFSSRLEGLPVALLEGLAAARPVVATAVGGIPAVVTHDVTGLLVPPGQPEALAQNCLRLLHDPVLANRLGQAGHVHVKANYSFEAMLDQTTHLYEALLKRKQPAGEFRPASSG